MSEHRIRIVNARTVTIVLNDARTLTYECVGEILETPYQLVLTDVSGEPLASLNREAIQSWSSAPAALPHGGSAWARLPRTAPARRRSTRHHLTAVNSPKVRDGRRLRILVVEDQEGTRKVLRFLLELWGHDVTEAADGARGLDRLLASEPDVALIDIGLPDLDGYALARAARAAPGGRGLFLVAVTARGRAADRRQALEVGFDAHLVKPVPAQVLRRTLAAAVEAATRLDPRPGPGPEPA